MDFQPDEQGVYHLVKHKAHHHRRNTTSKMVQVTDPSTQAQYSTKDPRNSAPISSPPPVTRDYLSKSEMSNYPQQNEISSKFSSFNKKRQLDSNQERLIESLQQDDEDEYSDSRLQQSQQLVRSYVSTIPKRFEETKRNNSQFPAQRFRKKTQNTNRIIQSAMEEYSPDRHQALQELKNVLLKQHEPNSINFSRHI